MVIMLIAHSLFRPPGDDENGEGGSGGDDGCDHDGDGHDDHLYENIFNQKLMLNFHI